MELLVAHPLLMCQQMDSYSETPRSTCQILVAVWSFFFLLPVETVSENN